LNRKVGGGCTRLVVFNLFCTATHYNNPLQPNEPHLKLQQSKCNAAVYSDAFETVTFETETEIWLKFRDETETLSKTLRPRLETWSSRPRFQTLCILPKFFKKMLSSLLTIGVRGGRAKRAFLLLEIDTKHQDSLENMKSVAQFRSID